MKVKKILNINLFAIVVLLFLNTSCEKWIDTDINTDPNNPVDVSMKLLLPSIQANMAYDLGGNDLVKVTNQWMQYYNGYARQSLSEGRYVYSPSSVNNLWNSVYAGTLNDLNEILKKAAESNSPHWEGVAKVCMAYVFGTMTDVFGDIPFTEAFQGNDNITPAYDSQQSVYAGIQTMLSEAITALQATENNIAVEGDLIYAGDLSKWVKAAYALKARYAITLSGVNGSAAYTEALGYLANGFTNNSDNFQFNFNETENHPIYNFMKERGDITMASTFIDMLYGDLDFRLLSFSNDGFSSVGGEPGTDQYDGIALPGEYAAGKAASSYFMTYAEQNFIIAEALLSTDVDSAYGAYIEGTLAATDLALNGVVLGQDINGDDVVYSRSVIKAQTWYAIISVGSGNLDLETIMKQKYIAAYNTPQSFVDYRRSGYPVLSRAFGANSDIPKRYPYAQNEFDYNGNNVPKVTMQTNLWWDK